MTERCPNEMGSVNLAASSLRLLTFNIRFGSGCEKIHIPGYDLQSSLKNLYAIAAAIDSIKPDVVALQEVRGAAQAEKIAGKLGMQLRLRIASSGIPVVLLRVGSGVFISL